MSSKVLDGPMFVELLRGGVIYLSANCQEVNDLNVFPIPDGDTGENMMRTINGGLSYAEKCEDDSLSSVAQAAAKGMILNARGNSGVILSQLAAGLADGFEDCDEADAEKIAYALKSGVERAYSAVMNPTEGTMLTVARESTEYVNKRIGNDSTVDSVLEDCLAEMDRSLQRTPDLLDVLKEAGVIDSGGAGLVYIVQGAYSVLRGETLSSHIGTTEVKQVDITKFNSDSIMRFGYCTEFLLQLQNSKIYIGDFSAEKFRDELSDFGNSIVCFQMDSIVKVHIHTMNPGDVLNHCQKYGEFLTMKIENMTLQHNSTYHESDVEEEEREPAEYASVIVATGYGVCEVMRSLGADVIIEGGQGNNPSAETFLDAFRAANAKTVFVFPNNSNIIMTAKQAADLCEDCDVRVIESRDIGQCYAAMTMTNYDLKDADAVEENFKEAI
jgi:DAK2 domain fusion protein YloV